MGGYQVGNYPAPWCEWNGKYRDTLREFWNLGGSSLDQVATRLAGSSDLFQHNHRGPYNSVNFITCHDGFCLQDLVSYNQKHNEANGEDNRDGTNDNRSTNCGEEGISKRANVLALRARQKRNLMASLLLSQGIPMLHHGDELSHTKQGNNNTYCQDNDLNWLNWNLNTDEEKQFLVFMQRLVALRHAEPVLRRKQFFKGEPTDTAGIRDIFWFSPHGHDMTVGDWHNPHLKAFGFVLEGQAIDQRDDKGQPLLGDSLLILINGSDNDVAFTMPSHYRYAGWDVVLDTTTPDGSPRLARTLWESDDPYPLMGRSLLVFKLRHVPLPSVHPQLARPSLFSIKPLKGQH
jgi:glycogen operon protein